MLIKDEIEYPPGSDPEPTVFGPYVAGDPDYNGVCEVCHEGTEFHRNDSTGDHTHYVAQDCIPCHKHSDEFIHGGGQSCETCHGHDGDAGTAFSHATHTAGTVPKGPETAMLCGDCHSDPIEMDPTPTFADDKPLGTTEVCNPCHSPDGAFDGVNDLVAGAKANWSEGVYESDGITMKPGTDQWCAGCHDDMGANSKQDATGITAPNISGDSEQETHGYYVSGHGRPSANLTCDVCHDVNRTHIDHDPRTYDVNESSRVGNDISTYAGHGYRKGYRLKAGLEMPRTSYDDDYYLCTDCHQAVMGTKSNFADVDSDRDNLHTTHVAGFGSLDWGWDSDADGVSAGTYVGDSFMSCTGCHNVHGSPMDVNYDGVLTPNRIMARYGELMNAEPGLNFRWYTGSYVTGVPTDKRNDSLSGTLSPVAPFCSFAGCHGGGLVYNRTPYIFLPGFLVDDFESYGTDEALQTIWTNKYDAKPAIFELDAGPDGSRCMRVRTVWTRNVEDHGTMKRVYDPYVKMGQMESMSFQLMVGNIDKIVQIGVMLKTYPDETLYEATVSTSGLQSGIWSEITIPISSFGMAPFDKLSEVRFHIYEVTPEMDLAVNVYLDDIRFTPSSYTVSGSVSGGSVGPLDGVIMRGFPGENVVTSGGGLYSATVYDTGAGWAGTVIPGKPGYLFDPPERPYSNVTSNLTGQDYTPTLDTSAIISESFEGVGYEEAWSENVGVNCDLDEDSAIPGTPPVDLGSQCLKSVSDDTGYKARADLDDGVEQPRTFTTFYCYVEAESLGADEEKNIGIFMDNTGNTVAILRLFESTEGDLKFRVRRYNNGGYANYDSGAIFLNTWYKIQFKYDDRENTWEWRLDGALQGSGDLTGIHRTGLREWRLGFWKASQAETGIIYIDKFSVSTGAYVAD